MTRLALFAALLAAPAYAETRAAWGDPVPFTAELRHGTECTLAVVIQNRLVANTGTHVAAVLTLDGVEVQVAAFFGPGDVPDRVTVTPPPGWYAEPAVSDVAENASAVVHVCQEGLA